LVVKAKGGFDMRNIREMNNILIDITNACNMTCSNCTRFCGHFRSDKIYFMDLDYFEKAVDSMMNFPNTVGVMGGEPTLHPNFPEICEIMQKLPEKRRRGLWSNTLTPQFQKYGSLINQTFGMFNLNDHKSKPIKHTPILMASEDFKDVSKSEMDKIIDECWVQNFWSATITIKGAFFCEVAATMSTLFDGPVGWDITERPEWWKKEISEYKNQKEWACDKCGCAIPLTPRRSNEVIDDISISNLKRLQGVGSPKIKQGKFVLQECSKKYIDKKQVRNCAWYWG